LHSVNIDALLRKVPIGSRVSWTNNEAKVTSVWRVENTIKMGNDKFQAHPLSEIETPEK
jgi:hypothetical protein